MAPEVSRVVRRTTFVLLALAAAAVEVAAADTRPVLVSLGLAAAWVGLAAVVNLVVPVPTDPRASPPVFAFFVALALAVAPFAVEPLRRDWTGDGYPLELQLVFGFRNVGLGLAACGGWVLCQRTAAVASLFLILFAAAMTNHPAVMVLLGLYTAAGGFWLTLAHWTGLRAVLVSTERSVAVELQPDRQRLPWAGLVVLVLAVGGGLAVAVVGPKQMAFALGELVPTSGGTGDTDPFARYGVGDGPEETAGDDAKAAGMVDTDKMIEDNKDALIDVANDMYGPPHKPPKNQDRMVAAGKVDVIQNHEKLPDNRRPSRDFDTGRKGPKSDKKPDSRAARGLFEVEGRTPLHVRAVAYDRYDAAAGRWREAAKPTQKRMELEGRDWVRVPTFPAATPHYREDERHRLKAAALKTNLVPTPTLLTRFRIARVDKADYYEWDYDGVLALAGRRRTPPGTVVTTDCRTVDFARVPESAFALKTPADGPPAAEVVRLAREWAGGLPRGPTQIEVVLNKLRAEYTFDRGAAAPPDDPSPVLWFLTRSRRGPDYLFASAAALLLDSLGYSTRLCLGYYADPAAYDPETAHTPVTEADLHAWAEVRLTDGQWLVLEATPGYAVLGPSLPLSERIRNALLAAAAWAGRYAVELAATLLAIAGLWLRRRELLDRLGVLWWRVRPGRTWRDQVRRAVAVLERRGRWAGRPRAGGQTAAGWLRTAFADPDAVRLSHMAEWGAYAPDGPPPWPPGEAAAVCRRVLRCWSLRRCRTAFPRTAS